MVSGHEDRSCGSRKHAAELHAVYVAFLGGLNADEVKLDRVVVISVERFQRVGISPFEREVGHAADVRLQVAGDLDICM